MEKFVPFEKLSKKQQKQLNKSRRHLWDFSPITKCTKNAKAYNRKKLRAKNQDTEFFFEQSTVAKPMEVDYNRVRRCI